jgi:uncharacterized membrane protein
MLIITSILFVLMVLSGLRNVRGRSNIIIPAAAFIVLLFLPLTANTDNINNALFQSQSVFAQQQDEEEAERNFLVQKQMEEKRSSAVAIEMEYLSLASEGFWTGDGEEKDGE